MLSISLGLWELLSLSLHKDADPREQHRDGAGGVAAGLHAPRVPLPRGVRRHSQEDRDSQEVKSQLNSQCGERKCERASAFYLFVLTALEVVPF